MGKLVSVIFVFCALISTGVDSASAAGRGLPVRCKKPWVFFDLGDTLVDTKTSEFKRLTYMPGAREYIARLARRGYPLGLIVNIPAAWGHDRAERVVALRKFIDEKWVDAYAFDWSLFAGHILVPNADTERKPQPTLFQEAKKMAEDARCPLVYEGEDAIEVKAATEVGLAAYQIGVSELGMFMPEDLIRKLRYRSSDQPSPSPRPEPLPE